MLASKFRFFIKLATFIGVMCSPMWLWAEQPYLWRQKQFTINDGLSSNKITCLLQDSRGYLWIGTEDGLNRYDGNHVMVYRHTIDQPTSISDNYIQAICESSTGSIWVGTRYGGISIWNRNDDTFSHIQKEQRDHKSLPENEICGLLEADGDKMWVKTRNFLALVSLTDNRVESYGHYTNVFKTDSEYSYPLLKVKGHKVLLGTKDGLNLFDPTSLSFTRIRNGQSPSEFFQETVTDLVAMGDHVFVLSESGLYSYAEKTHAVDLLSVSDNVMVGGGKLLRSGNGHVWIGTNGGLLKIDKHGSPTGEYIKLGAGNQSDEITDLIEDKSGIIWIGTKFNGLFKVDSKPNRFQSIDARLLGFHDSGPLNVSSLLFYEPNQIWIGTQNNGLWVYDRQTNRSTQMPIQSASLGRKSLAVTALYADKKRDIWIGTNHGIFKYLAESKKIVEFGYAKNKEFATLLQENEIRTIVEDLTGNFWFATKFGLYKYNGKDIESFFSEADNLNSLTHDEINCLLVDNDNVLWVGTRKGLNKSLLARNGFERLTHSDPKMNALFNDFILSMTQDESGNIWVGTRKGLARYNKVTKSFKVYAVSDGLANDVLNGVLCDRLNRIWVSTNLGISCVINNLVINFSDDDGLSGYVFNPGAVYENSMGELFFGGFGGISYLAPGVIELNKKIPSVVIQGVKIYSRGDLVQNLSGELRSLSYKYLKNSTLKIDFAALEFTQPHQNRYKVMLEGFDNRWSAPFSESSVDYSNLPPGQYKLKVMGSNNDLIWNDTPALLDISISPPIYRSVYAIIFYFVALIVLFQVVVNYRIRNYRKAYKNLQEKAEDKNKLELQKEALAKTHKSLTDSINYAKRIQEAMLFSEEAVKRLLPESFVYYRPKDIVSGDFYYFYARKNKLIIAAVDCTGHGVPGAFMSIIGYDLMRNIVEVQGIDCPATILDMMNEQLNATFLKESSDHGKEMEMKDGMDMAICVLDYGKNVAEFAGANSSIYMVRENELLTYDGNRASIGLINMLGKYTKQQFAFHENDIIYMFSDGYTDQFGGPDGKKFKYRRFRHLLLNIHKMPMEDQKAILHQKMEEWMGESYEQIDDILMMGFKPIASQLV